MASQRRDGAEVAERRENEELGHLLDDDARAPAIEDGDLPLTEDSRSLDGPPAVVSKVSQSIWDTSNSMSVDAADLRFMPYTGDSPEQACARAAPHVYTSDQLRALDLSILITAEKLEAEQAAQLKDKGRRTSGARMHTEAARTSG